MNGKSKSILLQVAFKGAISLGKPDTDTIRGLYETLLVLHDQLSINADDDARSRGGSGWSGGSGQRSTTLPEGTSVFTARDTQMVDYRAAKTAGNVKPGFPDFKTLDGSKIFEGFSGPNDGVWLIDPKGNANEDISDLVEAAQQGALL